MDEQEVERLARLMHVAWEREYARKNPNAEPPITFDTDTDSQRDYYRVVARAVIADQYAPTAVVTG